MPITQAIGAKKDDDLAIRLFIAISKCQYRKIEDLVDDDQNKGLLSAIEMDGNTYLHLVANMIERHGLYQRGSIEVPTAVEKTAPFIHKVYRFSVNLHSLIHPIIFSA